MPKYKHVTTLKNGMKIWIENKTKSKSLKIGVYILSGAYTETKELMEYNHLFEHLIANMNSKKFPDSRESNKLLELNGIDANGSVDKYVTHIWLDGHAHAFELMIDIFMNAILYFKVDKNVLSQEKEAVITELSGMMDEPHFEMEELQNKVLFPKHISSYTIEDHISNCRKIKAAGMEHFVKRLLDPKRMVFYIVGNNGNTPHLKKIIKAFEDLKPPSSLFSIKSLASYVPRNRSKKRIHYVRANTNTTKLEWIWQIPIKAFNEESVAPIDAVASIIRDKVFDKLRLDDGLIYSPKYEKSYDPVNKYLTHLSVFVDVEGSKDKIKRAIHEMDKIFKNLEKIITKTELLRFKRKQYRMYQDHIDDCTPDRDIEEYIDFVLFHKKIITERETLDEYMKLTLKDLHSTIRKYITLNKSYLFYSGPVHL